IHGREQAVRIFDAKGKFVSMLGSPGDGPGEFRVPTLAGTLGDSIWIFDQKIRFTLFGPNLKTIGLATPQSRSGHIFSGLGPRREMLVKTTQTSDSVGIFRADGTFIRNIAFRLRSNAHEFTLADPNAPVANSARSGGAAAPGQRRASFVSPLSATA